MTQLKLSKKPLPPSVAEAVWTSWTHLGRQPRMRMVSGSMRPLIKVGDELHLELHPQTIYLGDVLIYRHRDQFIAHRLVDIHQSGKKIQFILKGDAIAHFDPPLSRKQIIGRVICVQSTLGCANYNAKRWRRFNALIARFSKWDRVYRRPKRYVKYMIKSIATRFKQPEKR